VPDTPLALAFCENTLTFLVLKSVVLNPWILASILTERPLTLSFLLHFGPLLMQKGPWPLIFWLLNPSIFRNKT
jgi:hypothetical protein